MKRLVLYAVILALVWIIPTEQVDVAQLRPVEVIALYKQDGAVVLVTDTEDLGVGKDAIEALANMRSTTPAIIYLDTAEYCLVAEDTEGEAETLSSELKGSIKICKMSGKVNLKDAAKYLPVHGQLPKIRDWKPGDTLPVLHLQNDRLKLLRKSEKSA